MSFLTVLLTILKIIGIVIASVTGLMLILVLLFLLSPVRYKGRIKFDGSPLITARGSYLFHIVSVHFDMNSEGSDFSVRIFGHKLRNRDDKKKSGHRTSGHPSRQEFAGNLPRVEISDNPPGESKSGQDSQSSNENIFTDQPEQGNAIHITQDKKGIFKKAKDIYNKVIAKIKRIYEGLIGKIKKIYHKITSMADNITEKRDRLFSEINDPVNKRGFRFAIDLVKKLIKHILPGKYSIFIRFGTDDPAVTGELVGLVYTFAVTTGLNVRVNPDFENKVFECDIPFKGRICIIRLVIWAIKAYRNKDFRQLIGKFG